MAGCGDSSSTSPPGANATSVSLSPSELTLAAGGETGRLTATVKDKGGATVPGAVVSWSSSDNSSATVSSQGVVTPLAFGRVTVTATSGDASAAATVTVLTTTPGSRDSGFGIIAPGTGGVVTSENGWSRVTAPAGSAVDTVLVEMELLDDGSCEAAGGPTRASGCWGIDRYPAGTFDQDVVVEICVADPGSEVMTDQEYRVAQRLYRMDRKTLEVTTLPLVNSELDCSDFPSDEEPNMRPPRGLGGRAASFSWVFGAVPDEARHEDFPIGTGPTSGWIVEEPPVGVDLCTAEEDAGCPPGSVIEVEITAVAAGSVADESPPWAEVFLYYQPTDGVEASTLIGLADYAGYVDEGTERAYSWTITLKGGRVPEGAIDLYAVGLTDPSDGGEIFATELVSFITAHRPLTCATQTELPQAECETLITLWDSTNGRGWTTSTGWVSTTSPCSWYGVVCEDGAVRSIDLEANQLAGTIPAELGTLTHLEALELQGNQLTGAIPPELGNLANLTALSLFSNQLSELVPLEVAVLGASIQSAYGLDQCSFAPPGNENLSLPDNPDYRAADLDGDGYICGVGLSPAFDCSIQSEIPEGECRALVALYDYTNGPGWTESRRWVSSQTPCSWQGVTCVAGSVTRLELDANGLAGTIPGELGNLRNLEQLQLAGNQLTGAIPSELGSLAKLEGLFVDHNQLTGAIPSMLGNLASLRFLSAFQNQLTGAIPPELGNLESLQDLRLSFNELTGSVPVELGSLSNLHWLSLSSNQLTGGIPSELGNLGNLQNLELGANPLGGPITPELGNLTNLLTLTLAACQLTGAIPSELGKLSNLQSLGLGGNQLTGAIPPELGNLAVLESLLLQLNQLSGAIPSELGNLASLEQLNLAANHLTGNVPPELGALTKLQFLDLNFNQLSGAIPSTLGNLVGLQYLALVDNELTGPVPGELGNLVGLTQLWMYGNQLAGPIPPELGNLTNLELLALRANQLTGPIPPELGNLASLQYLGVSSNMLTGTIPSELGKLGNLETLSLEENQLTGAIPPELGNLSKLGALKLQLNQLSGLVPLSVARLGGQIQSASGYCALGPGNEGLYFADTQDYRDADLNGDGFICGLVVPTGTPPSILLTKSNRPVPQRAPPLIP